MVFLHGFVLRGLGIVSLRGVELVKFCFGVVYGLKFGIRLDLWQVVCMKRGYVYVCNRLIDRLGLVGVCHFIWYLMRGCYSDFRYVDGALR